MNLPLIDTKAIAREQNALRRKYEKVIESASELSMSDEMKQRLFLVFEASFREQFKVLVDKAMNGELPVVSQAELILSDNENKEDIVL